jgi:hypothetical protein
LTLAVATPVSLEHGRRKVFASALEWPGWCRAARSEEEALDALGAYRDRYRLVVTDLADTVPEDFEVVERCQGNATTDFGAPAVAARYESRSIDAHDAARLRAVLEACWAAFDAISEHAPRQLRKGPRGGGRDTDQIVAHVTTAEAAYARKLGFRGSRDDPGFRQRLAELVGSPSDGRPLTEKGWVPRYAVRRIAWHLLDHAWEIEDKSES